MELPKTIYLQWCDDDDEELAEITWCVDRIYDRDGVYELRSAQLSLEQSGPACPLCNEPEGNCVDWCPNKYEVNEKGIGRVG